MVVMVVVDGVEGEEDWVLAGNYQLTNYLTLMIHLTITAKVTAAAKLPA